MLKIRYDSIDTQILGESQKIGKQNFESKSARHKKSIVKRTKKIRTRSKTTKRRRAREYYLGCTGFVFSISMLNDSVEFSRFRGLSHSRLKREKNDKKKRTKTTFLPSEFSILIVWHQTWLIMIQQIITQQRRISIYKRRQENRQFRTHKFGR